MTEIAKNEELSLEDQLAQQLCSYHLTPKELGASDKPIRFIMGKAGVYRAISNPIGLFVAKAVTVPGLPAYSEGLNLSLPKVPYDMFLNTAAFFREVMKQHRGAEAMVQFYWNAEARTWFMACPEQVVSGAAVHFQRNQVLDQKYLLVMDIHSHNTMGAFWSGTDTADEKETRVYGVFGNLDRPLFNHKFRICVGGDHKDITIGDIFDLPAGLILTVAPPTTGTFPAAWVAKCKSAPPLTPVVSYLPRTAYPPYTPYNPRAHYTPPRTPYNSRKPYGGSYSAIPGGIRKFDEASGEWYTEIPGDYYNEAQYDAAFLDELDAPTRFAITAEQRRADKLEARRARKGIYIAEPLAHPTIPGAISGTPGSDPIGEGEDGGYAGGMPAWYGTGAPDAPEEDDETLDAHTGVIDTIFTWSPEERKAAIEALIEAYIDEVAAAVGSKFGAYDEITSAILREGY